MRGSGHTPTCRRDVRENQPGTAWLCPTILVQLVLSNCGDLRIVGGMKFPRCSGILLHITSLPGRFGIGDLGPCAYEFADFLSVAGQKLWQVLPLNPTGYGDSPYQCFSAFAGNPLLLSLERLRDVGTLEASDLARAPAFPEDSVDYGTVIEFKIRALRRAAQVFMADGSHAERSAFERFCESAGPWLDDYALFIALKDQALKDQHRGAMWTGWDAPLRRRDPATLHEWSRKLAPELAAKIA